MQKILFIIVIVLSLFVSLVAAVSQKELDGAKKIIDSNATCDKLSNENLELIGEYYMEQMMPGEAHKRAHEMMGLEEGSDAEEQFHISMAKRMYCNESAGIAGMMGGRMMGGNMMNNMMGGGMMNMMGNNMMNFGKYPYNYTYSNSWDILWIIIWAAIIISVFWFIYKYSKKENEKSPWLWILIAAVVLLIIFGGFGGYGMMGFGFLFMLIFWGAIIWIIVTLINSAQSNKKDDSDPLTILKKRFAKGEITKKQFEKIKKEIN